MWTSTQLPACAHRIGEIYGDRCGEVGMATTLMAVLAGPSLDLIAELLTDSYTPPKHASARI